MQSPVELKPQMEIAPSVFQSLGCKIFQVSRYEADDLMATLGKWAKQR
jgi:5'-3' exonuclease